jgi:hypothetical protein
VRLGQIDAEFGWLGAMAPLVGWLDLGLGQVID